MNLGQYIVPDEVKNGICLDIGSNYGDFTDKYKDFFSKIYFVEAQTTLFNNIKIRFKDFNNIIGFNNAVWNESNVSLDMIWHDNHDPGSVGVKGPYVNNHWIDEFVNSVTSISLEDLLKEINHDKIDYLKLDCETSEYPFLYGKDLTPFKYIGAELHFQLGEQKYNELLSFITKTHDLISGDMSYVLGSNKEVLFKLRQ